MDNVDDMMESYIGKEILEEPLEQFDKLNTPAVQFDFKTIAFAFLPNQVRDSRMQSRKLQRPVKHSRQL